MSVPFRRFLAHRAARLALAACCAAMPGCHRKSSPAAAPPAAAPPAPETPPPPVVRLADLTPPPDWSRLACFQGTITRAEFEDLLTRVFTVSGRWGEFIEIGETAAAITTHDGQRFILRFAEPGKESAPPRYWRPARDLGPAPADKPLTGLRVVLDPGHLGGPWARMEQRWFSLAGARPVAEGDLTLQVAKLLVPRLQALGAEVSAVRDDSEPVTPWRPGQLLDAAAEELARAPNLLETPKQVADRLFYRTAEIRSRAELVNSKLKPDVVLCLHFNAEAWGDPGNPSLVPRDHLHLLIAGAFSDDEVALEDQRFEMVRKLLQRTHAEEVAVCATVAKVFAQASGLPPYCYEATSPHARNINGNPYLWARNLLANRLYDCPVVYLEPYVMNSPITYARIQAGDYDGVREINGTPWKSIFREYADAVATGLATYCRAVRENLTQ